MFQALETWAEEAGIGEGVHRVPVVSRRGTGTGWGTQPWAAVHGYVRCPQGNEAL